MTRQVEEKEAQLKAVMESTTKMKSIDQVSSSSSFLPANVVVYMLLVMCLCI